MKQKTSFFICGIICSIFATGCYPTGQNINTEEIVFDGNLNESPREDLVYKFTIPEEYPESYNVTKAKFRNFDASLAEELFPHCTDDPVEIQHHDERNYTLYLKENSWVNFMDGTVTFWNEYEYEPHKILAAIYMPKPFEQIKSEFPNIVFKNFSSEQPVSEMNRIIRTLDIKVSEPHIYSFDRQVTEYIDDTYFIHGFEHEELKEDIYAVSFDVMLGELPVSKQSFGQILSSEWHSVDTQIYGLFNKNGLIEFNARDIPEISETGKNAHICSPETAVSQIKNYIEGTAESGTIFGCELKALTYYYEGVETDEYMVRPVWVFGFQSEEGSLLNPLYVDAVSGMML